MPVISMNGGFDTSMQSYIIDTLAKHCVINKKNHYKHSYRAKQLKRFLWHTMMAFFLQYLTMSHLTFSYPALPINPCMGAAFMMLYLLGPNALLGLMLGAILGYVLHGFSFASVCLYVWADIGGAYLSVSFSRLVLSSDLSVFIYPKEWLRFVQKNMLMACVLTTVLRTVALVLVDPSVWHGRALGYYMFDIWLSDLNGLLVFSGFLLTWLSVYLSREKVSDVPLDNLKLIAIPVLVIVAMIVVKHAAVTFILGLVVALYLSYYYGVLMATVLTYALAMVFIVYITNHQQLYLDYLGLRGYTVLPLACLGCMLLVFFVGQSTSKHRTYAHFLS